MAGVRGWIATPRYDPPEYHSPDAAPVGVPYYPDPVSVGPAGDGSQAQAIAAADFYAQEHKPV